MIVMNRKAIGFERRSDSALCTLCAHIGRPPRSPGTFFGAFTERFRACTTSLRRESLCRERRSLNVHRELPPHASTANLNGESLSWTSIVSFHRERIRRCLFQWIGGVYGIASKSLGSRSNLSRFPSNARGSECIRSRWQRMFAELECKQIM